MRKVLSLLLACLLLFGLAACDNNKQPATDDAAVTTVDSDAAVENTSGDSESEAASTEAPQGDVDVNYAEDQTYYTFLSSEPTTLDAGKASDNYALTVINATQEPLIGIRNDDNGQMIYTNECAAESWDISEDGKTYTLHLRANNWSDGQPVVAQDYVNGILRNVNPETGCPYSYFLDPIKGAKAAMAGKGKLEDVAVTAPDEKTLVIELEDATPHFLSVLGTSVTFAVRQDKVDEIGSEAFGSEPDKMVYNGSHKVVEWVHNSKITLEPNEHYWNKDKVHFKTVHMPIVNDVNALMNMMLTGEIRAVSTNIAEWRQQFEGNDDIIHITLNNPQTFFMTFNCNDELFSNVKVRKAFSAALDRADFNEQIWDGNNTPATGWVPHNIYVDTLNYIEKAPQFIPEMIEEVGDPKALLAEGLKEVGRSESPDELTVSIILGSTDQWFKNFGEYLQQRFKQILGVTLDVAQMDWPVFQDRISKSDYQIGYMGWGSETPEPIAMLSLHLSDSNQLGTGWKNEEFDKLVKQAEHEQDPAKRLELYAQAETILMNESPVAPVVFSNSNAYRYKNVQGVDYCPFGNLGFRIGYIVNE